MKKFILFLVPVLGALHANQCQPQAPVCYTEDLCEQCYCLGPEEIIANAPVGPMTCDGDISLTVSGLYWKAAQDGMEYAVDIAVFIPFEPNLAFLDDPTPLQEANNLIDAHYLSPNFKWSFGFQLGIGYISNCDGWDLGILWTRYNGRASSHDEIEKEDNHSIVTLWSAFQQPYQEDTEIVPGPLAYDISTKWNLDLNLVDLDLGRAFWVSRYLIFRPHIGFRLASVDQHFRIEQTGISWIAATTTIGGRADIMANDFVDFTHIFRGVGPHAGFNLNWHLGCGWSVYSNLAAAILYGNFKVTHDEVGEQAIVPFEKLKILDTKNHFKVSRAILDLALGLEYSALVCDCRYRFSAKLGWEAHAFLHQNQMWRVERKAALFNASGPFTLQDLNTGKNDYEQRRGTLTTQGLTLTLKFDF